MCNKSKAGKRLKVPYAMKGFRVKVIYKGLKGINEGIWSTNITLKYHVLILRTYLESMSLRLSGKNVNNIRGSDQVSTRVPCGIWI